MVSPAVPTMRTSNSQYGNTGVESYHPKFSIALAQGEDDNTEQVLYIYGAATVQGTKGTSWSRGTGPYFLLQCSQSAAKVSVPKDDSEKASKSFGIR